MHRQTDGRTDGQTDKWTDRQTGRETHAHTRTHTHTYARRQSAYSDISRRVQIQDTSLARVWDLRQGCRVLGQAGEGILRRQGRASRAKIPPCGQDRGRIFDLSMLQNLPDADNGIHLVQVNILMALQGDHRCVRLLRSFDYRGHICLVFELLGPNLYEVMRANSFKPFSVSEIRILARQVLESLAHTHAKGVVHTDVKPENVLFEELLHKRRNSHALAQGGRLQVTPGTQVQIITSLRVDFSSVSCLNAFPLHGNSFNSCTRKHVMATPPPFLARCVHQQ